MIARVVRILALAVALNLMLVAPASAYIDAGSTAVIFQAVVAGIAAAGVSISVFWSRIKRFLDRGDAEAAPTSDAEVEAEVEASDAEVAPTTTGAPTSPDA